VLELAAVGGRRHGFDASITLEERIAMQLRTRGRDAPDGAATAATPLV